MSDSNVRGRSQSGFSIVELMVAITIGAILLGGAVTLFVNNRQTYTISTDLARLQENARFALEMITKDVRMAGYVGCFNNLASVNNTTGATSGELWDPTYEIEGIDNAGGAGTWIPSDATMGGVEALGAGVPSSGGDNRYVVAGTDAITIRYLKGWLADAWDPLNGNVADNIPDLQVTAATNTQLTVNYYDPTTMANLGFAVGETAGVADCGVGDIFVVDSIDTTNHIITADTALSRTYSPGSNPKVAPFYAVRYFIGNNADNEPSLYRVVMNGGLNETPEELFEGVEDMQILYGVDTRDSAGLPVPDRVPDIWLAANDTDATTGADLTNGASNTWHRVVAVRIALLLRTPQFGRSGEAAADTQAYNMLGTAVGPFNDRRRRRVFQATALARNMQATN